MNFFVIVRRAIYFIKKHCKMSMFESSGLIQVLWRDEIPSYDEL